MKKKSRIKYRVSSICIILLLLFTLCSLLYAPCLFAQAQTTIDALTPDTNPTGTDKIHTWDTEAPPPRDRKVLLSDLGKAVFAYKLRGGLASALPGTCTESGVTGTDIYWATDTNILYVCTATNTWTIYSGSGDVVGPATNTDNYIPQWNGANSKTLKNGLALSDDTTLAGDSSTAVTTEHAVKTYADGKIPKSTIAAAGDILVGLAASTPGVVTKGPNNSLFGINDSGMLGFYTSIYLDIPWALGTGTPPTAAGQALYRQDLKFLYIGDGTEADEQVNTTGTQTLTNKTLESGSNTIKMGRVGTFASPITDNPYTLTAANCYNSTLYYGATGQINLPAAVAGMALVIYNKGAYTITVEPNGTDVIVRNGTEQSAGVNFTLSNGAGNYVTLISDVNNHWITLGYKGTLAQGS